MNDNGVIVGTIVDGTAGGGTNYPSYGALWNDATSDPVKLPGVSGSTNTLATTSTTSA